MTAQRVVMVVDMQNGVFATPRLARCVAPSGARGGQGFFIQHDEAGGLEAGSEGSPCFLSWSSRLARCMSPKPPAMPSITSLAQVLDEHDIQQFVICGCATDYCLDTTIKMAPAAGTVLLLRKMPHHADRPARRPRRLSPTTMRCGVRRPFPQSFTGETHRNNSARMAAELSC